MDEDARRRAVLAKFKLHVQITDSEFECYDYHDIGDIGMDTFGNLLVTDHEGMTLLCLSAGSWFSFSTSREPRLESTSDATTSDGDDDGSSASQREPDLPRDGARSDG